MTKRIAALRSRFTNFQVVKGRRNKFVSEFPCHILGKSSKDPYEPDKCVHNALYSLSQATYANSGAAVTHEGLLMV